MKKKDWIVIGILCVVLGIGCLIFKPFQQNKFSSENGTLEVYYKDELIDKIDISKNEIYTYEGAYGKFSLEIKDKKYHAANVECPNHDCEKMGWFKEGSILPIVCIPNEIYVIQNNVEPQY